MFFKDKREHARCIREAALGFDDQTASTMIELAEELEAQAEADKADPAPPERRLIA